MFIPCLVRDFLPNIGISTAQVLKYLGYEVHFDPEQVCCGQIFINWGQFGKAARLASRFIHVFSDKGIVVGPSGSCVSAVREKYALLDLAQKDLLLWKDLKQRLFSFIEFLLVKGHQIKGRLDLRIAMHRSCHLYRSLGVDPATHNLYSNIKGLEVLVPDGPPECCGFGGVFSVKMGEVAASIGHRAVKRLVDLDPDVIVVPDAGCILQVRSVLGYLGVNIPVWHPAELFYEAINGQTV